MIVKPHYGDASQFGMTVFDQKLDKWAVVGNIKDDKLFRDGAKLWMIFLNPGNASERAEFWGKSLGGRDIERFIDSRKLYDVRVSFVPPRVSERVGRMSKDQAEYYAMVLRRNIEWLCRDKTAST